MANRYVKAGSNGNGTESNPYGKIQAAINASVAGDTIHVMNGTYVESLNIQGFRGTASNPLTIKNYTGHSPWVDGQAGKQGGINSGLPGAPMKRINPNTGAGCNYGNLVKIRDCRYVVWDGVNIRGSLGRAIAVFDASQNVTIKNCKVGPSREINILVTGQSRNCTVQGCEVYESGNYYPAIRASNAGTDWCEGIAVQAAHDILIDDCLLYHNWGEVTIADANRGESSNVTVQNCVMYDNLKGPYMHALDGGIFRNNVVYRSDAEVRNRHYALGSHGVSVNAFESAKAAVPTYDVWIYNNLIINMATGIKCGGGRQDAPIQSGTRIYNNTIINCDVGAGLGTAHKKNMHFRNNIVMDCGDMARDNTSNDSRAATDWTFGNNLWQKNPGATYYDAGSDVITTNPGLVNKGAAVLPGKVNPANYKIASNGSAARNVGANLSTWVTDDFFGASRDATPDVGFHEYDGGTTPTAPTASITASVTSGEAPLTVNFTGTSVSGGTTPYVTYAWDFGDGNTSAVLEPSNTFVKPGSYTVEFSVTDTAGYVDVDTITINVTSFNAGGDDVNVDVVSGSGGDATFSVSGTPDAMMFVTRPASSEPDATIGVGIYAFEGGSHNQVAFALRSQNGETTQAADEIIEDGVVMVGLADGGHAVKFTAEVTAVSASSVSLTWTGDSSDIDFAVMVFYGQSVSNSKIITAQMGAADTISPTYIGDWSFLIAPVMARGVPSIVGTAQLSMGFASRNGGKGYVGYLSRDDNHPAAESKTTVGDDMLSWLPREGDQMDYDVWNSTGISFRALLDMNIEVPILMVGIPNDFNISISVEDTETSVGSASYGSLSTPQAAIAIGTRASQMGRSIGDEGGAMSVLLQDTSAGYVSYLSTRDGASPTEDWAYGETSKMVVPGVVTGTTEIEAASSLNSTSLALNYTKVASEPKKMLLVLFDGTSATTGPNAYFEITDPTDEVFPYTDTMTVQSLSTSDGINAITGYDWDWGDGTTHGTTEQDTHTYTDAGTFTVTLTVTDAAAATSTYTREVLVDLPEPAITFTVDPSPAEIDETITLDATGTAAAGTETIDWDNAVWVIRDLQTEQGHSTFALGGPSITTTISQIGVYDVRLHVPYERAYVHRPPGEVPFLEIEQVLTVARTEWDLDFSSSNEGSAVVGPVQITFTPEAFGAISDSATVDWDFGDTGTGSQEWGSADSITHTYSSVVSTTEYDVEMTVTQGGRVETVTKTDYITLVPTQVAPPTIPQLIDTVESLQATLENLKKHLGHIEPSEWSQSATYENVYYCQLNRAWVSGLTVTLIEDGVALTSQASEALVAANQGSFNASFSSPTLTIYVNTSDSDNPAINGRNYRFKAVT